MKTVLRLLILLTILPGMISSCSSDDIKYRDLDLSAVENLIQPTNDKSIRLISTQSATLHFEWEIAHVEDGGPAMYEVVFDVEGGDFSSPLYKVVADNNGLANHATIPHKDLNRMMGEAGISAEQAGSIIWTVISSRGINKVFAKDVNTLILTRSSGFSEIPHDVFIVGEATEVGNDIANAIQAHKIAEGEFEIFTQLESGKSYRFIDGITGNTRTFYAVGNKLKEDGEMESPGSGVYRIKLDFNVSSFSITRITSFGVFYCTKGRVTMPLEYKGFGIWKYQGYLEFDQQSWGRDERYKFEMETENGKIHWGTLNKTDSSPTASSSPSYYYLKEVEFSYWNDIWKFAREMDYSNVEITVSFSSEGNYTHSVVKK